MFVLSFKGLLLMSNVPTMLKAQRIMVSIVMYVMSAARAEEKLPAVKRAQHMLLQIHGV